MTAEAKTTREEIIKENIAYIDAANLHNAIKDNFPWKLNYKRFRVWLKDKYQVETAYLFIGLVAKNTGLYNMLQDAGYTLIFKDTICDGDGKVKGNCDADLVLKAARDYFEGRMNCAVIVSSDGDYASLVTFLKKEGAIKTILSPAPKEKCSILLKRTAAPIVYMGDVAIKFKEL